MNFEAICAGVLETLEHLSKHPLFFVIIDKNTKTGDEDEKKEPQQVNAGQTWINNIKDKTKRVAKDLHKEISTNEEADEVDAGIQSLERFMKDASLS